MGSSEAEIYLGASATVAASALTGVITDPRPYAGTMAGLRRGQHERSRARGPRLDIRRSDQHGCACCRVPSIRASIEEQRKQCFEAIRPGWRKEAREGEHHHAGSGFGTGSGRPAPACSMPGIRAIAANSVNALFLRNSVNSCVPAMEFAGISEMFKEGDLARLNFTTVRSTTSRRRPACAYACRCRNC